MTKLRIDRTDTIVFLGGITALTAVSIDIVLPTTGVVARYFGVEPQQGALLIGIYFIAYSIGQIFWGLFSDAFGRRKALILSLSGFAIASIICAAAPNFTVLIIARFAQGLMGAAPVIARAMVRDVASGKEAGRLMTVLGAILTISTMFAPVLGSGLLVLFSWRSLFIALTLLSLGFLAYTLLVLAETGRHRPERFTFGFLAHAGRYLLTNRKFLVPMLAGGMVFGGYASLGATGAIIAETRYGVVPEAFGALIAIAALVNTLGALSAGQLLKYVTLRQIGNGAACALAFVVVVHLGLSSLNPDLQVFWISVCAYVVMFGVIYPTAFASAMEPADEMPGFAASIMGSIQMAFGALGAFLASNLYDGTSAAIHYTMALFGMGAVSTIMLGRILDRILPK